MQLLPIRQALLSVTDKTGLPEFATFLHQGGVQLISTGGTRKALLEAGLPVRAVSDITGFPEILDGRVKTLHPHIHGPLLADKSKPEHLQTLSQRNLLPLDLVCVNLYDFGRALESELDLKDCVEQIDIGGPTMLRAAAKNFHSVLVIPTPEDYPRVMAELASQHYHVTLALRRETAAKTFRLTAAYDEMIAAYLSTQRTEVPT
ncbi:IMP cyclohydrolase [Desulfonatronum thioautotrophicum]|uniref:IMP cyclohydrolase n=1 Tax=Desulfonatronum thioautotrophicum TaxID=617001 RepID=UPI0005EB36A6|nr:IMP cyclohydrolase [Desulfonatronum thioautotrophicum]